VQPAAGAQTQRGRVQLVPAWVANCTRAIPASRAACMAAMTNW
jgi:hypothetical protein